MPTANYTEVEEPIYDIKITIKKFLTGLGMTLIPVILLYAIDFLEKEDFPEEYAIYVPIIVAILHAAANYVKHRNDTQTVKIDNKTGKVIN